MNKEYEYSVATVGEIQFLGEKKNREGKNTNSTRRKIFILPT